jgi:hypothetical protein
MCLSNGLDSIERIDMGRKLSRTDVSEDLGTGIILACLNANGKIFWLIARL